MLRSLSECIANRSPLPVQIRHLGYRPKQEATTHTRTLDAIGRNEFERICVPDRNGRTCDFTSQSVCVCVCAC